MRNLYRVISILLIAALAFTAAAIIEERYWNSRERELYPKGVTVEVLDRENDLVIASDLFGNLWGFKGCEDLEIGDVLALIMDSKGTLEIYDDAIVSLRCAY